MIELPSSVREQLAVASLLKPAFILTSTLPLPALSGVPAKASGELTTAMGDRAQSKNGAPFDGVWIISTPLGVTLKSNPHEAPSSSSALMPSSSSLSRKQSWATILALTGGFDFAKV